MLIRQEKEIQSFKNQLQAKEKKVAELQKIIDQRKAQNSRLYKETTAQPYSDKYEIVKEMALEVTGHDRVFGEQFKKFRIDGTLPLRIANLLDGYLKKILRSEGSLHDLLREFDDDEVLDRYAIDIAHILRKKRNKVAHLEEPEDSRIEMGRALFCLFGASLLFPELPEITEGQSSE